MLARLWHLVRPWTNSKTTQSFPYSEGRGQLKVWTLFLKIMGIALVFLQAWTIAWRNKSNRRWRMSRLWDSVIRVGWGFCYILANLCRLEKHYTSTTMEADFKNTPLTISSIDASRLIFVNEDGRCVSFSWSDVKRVWREKGEYWCDNDAVVWWWVDGIINLFSTEMEV